MTPISFFPLILIYLILAITIRGKKLETSDAAIYLFLGFLGVIASVVLASDTPVEYRIIIITLIGVACAIAGWLFYRHSKPKNRVFKPVLTVLTRWQRFKEAFFVSLGVFEIISLWLVTILAWQFFYIDGIPVVTYMDLLLVGANIFTILLIRQLWRYFKATEDEKRCFF